ncbi:MAG TPA: hypothetical protein VGL40_03775 [Bacillota bacterium]|jgi:hypothetical protein
MFEFLRARRKAETKTAGQMAVDRLRWVLAHDRAECWGDRAVRLAKKATDAKVSGEPGPIQAAEPAAPTAPKGVAPPPPSDHPAPTKVIIEQASPKPAVVLTTAAEVVGGPPAPSAVTAAAAPSAPVAPGKAGNGTISANPPQPMALNTNKAMGPPSDQSDPSRQPVSNGPVKGMPPAEPAKAVIVASADSEVAATTLAPAPAARSTHGPDPFKPPQAKVSPAPPTQTTKTPRMASKNATPPKSLGTFGGVPTPAWEAPKANGGPKPAGLLPKPSSLVTKPLDSLTRAIISSSKPIDTLIRPGIDSAKPFESFAKSITVQPKVDGAAPPAKSKHRKSAPQLLLPGGKGDKKRE